MQNSTEIRQKLRQLIRKKRNDLTAIQQKQAELSITQQALDLIEQFQAKHIALYFAIDGEISTQLLINTLWQRGKKVYLPVIHPFCAGHLLFLQYRSDSKLVKNQFSILQPQLTVKDVLPLSELDIIFTPLVAFDSTGQRLGMGGGFYDRTLENWQQKSFIPIGLAHQCQQVDKLPTQSWDIPLFKILSA